MYDDNYDIPGAFPAMSGIAPPTQSGGGGGGGGFASMLDNPMIMGSLMGLSNLRDPNSMSNAMQAMMQMKQSNQMMDYRNRSLDETSRYHGGALDLEKTKTDMLRQQMQMDLAQQNMVQGMLQRRFGGGQPGQPQPTGATAQVMQQAPPQPQPQGNPAARPDQNNEPTAPVFGNEVQGQPLPPVGQPQPTPGGNNAPQFPSPAQGGVGVDQAPPPDVLKAHYLTKVVGAEAGTNPDGSFRTSVKGAVGPGQVMPGTAPEAAKLAGLPFDDNKYRTDPQYNLALGEAYHKKQFDTFGNLPMADAAYNAGPGAVLTAQNRATKMGNPNAWLSFMPQETQAYVQKTTGYTGGMVPQELSKAGVQETQAALQPPQQAPQAPQGPQAAEGIAQVPGLPQIPGMPQQPSAQQGVTAPDDSEQRRQQVAMGLVLTTNKNTMAEGLKMINEAGQTKTYNKGQIVTNADGKTIMVDGPPTIQETFNNSIAAGKDYREALDTAMKVGKYPRELKKMDAEYQDTQAQTTERQAAAGRTTVETQAAQQKLKTTQATDYGEVLGTLNSSAQLATAAAKLRDNPGLDHITGPYSLLPDTVRTVIDPQGMNAHADMKAIGSKILLNTITALKSLSQNGSTGFGQLSNIEGTDIKNSVGSLNEAQTTGQIKERLGQVIDNSNKLIDRATSVYEQTHNQSPYQGLPIGTRPARESGGEPKMSKNGKPLLKLPDGKLMEVNE